MKPLAPDFLDPEALLNPKVPKSETLRGDDASERVVFGVAGELSLTWKPHEVLLQVPHYD